MHTLCCCAASSDLQPFVRVFAQREVCGFPGPTSQPAPARLEQTLEFQFQEPFTVSDGIRHYKSWPATIVGAYSGGNWAINLAGKITSFGIFFQPVGLSALFGIPPVELTGNAFDANDLLPRSFEYLHEQLAGCKSFESRVSLAERILRNQAARLHSRSQDLITQSADRIFAARGAVLVDNAASSYGFSKRHFERLFTARIGLPPKMFARVARFQTALDTKLAHSSRSWLRIAHDLRYHDQMHMVHDFHKLGGGAPGLVLASIGDSRPPAMPNFSQL